MCRWLAYSGGAIALSELIFDTRHSIIDQSLQSRSSVQTTNGDGFGVGWYDDLASPGMYKNVQPAWNDPNLRDVCIHTRSHLFLAHVRAATGTAIQQTNCHPFRHENWLFMHNGAIRDFARLHRRLLLEIDEELFPYLMGGTDSELMFFLALHFGLADNAYAGIARMAGFIERVGRDAGVEHPLQMTLGISDGEGLFACRYSSEKSTRTLHVSRDVNAIRDLVPIERRHHFDRVADDARTIVSEPFSDLPEMWQTIPESTWVSIEHGHIDCQDFVPVSP